MDEYFEYFLGKFGAPADRQWVPKSSIARYRGKLPEQLLTYWEEYGWAAYGKGVLWTVNPQEYEPVVEAWLGNTKFMGEDTYHVVTRSAFGVFHLFGERTGNRLNIVAPYSALMPPIRGVADRDLCIRAMFASYTHEAADFTDQDGNDLFEPAHNKLGPLEHDEMYGFVPALALGGPNTLDHLQKVKAVEHLVFLAQLSELRLFPSLTDE